MAVAALIRSASGAAALKLSKVTLVRLKRQAAAYKSRTARADKQKREEAKGKVVLKRVGKHKAYYVNGLRKTGIHRFLDERVVSKRSTRSVQDCKALTTPSDGAAAIVGTATGSDARQSSYQKGLRGRRRGTYIHKQVVKDALAGSRQGTAAEKRKKQKTSSKQTPKHPMIKTAYRLLDRCGYAALMGNAGVHIGRYATEIDLVCYKKGESKNRVIPVEIKTGFENLRDYTRPRYRMRIGGSKATRASSKLLCSKRDRDHLQLLSTVIACSASRPEWEIDDALLLNMRPSGAQLSRIPDSILSLRPALEAEMRKP